MVDKWHELTPCFSSFSLYGCTDSVQKYSENSKFDYLFHIKLPLKNIYPVSNPVKIDIGIMKIQYIWCRKKMYFGETFIIYVCNFYIHF